MSPPRVHFRVFIPFRNAKPYLAGCLESLAIQSYPHWTAYCFDDASDDGGGVVALQRAEADARFRHFRSATRVGMLGNFERLVALTEIREEDVIVQLDGDDQLADGEVLARVARAYQDLGVWITYGNFLRVGARFDGDETPMVGFCRQVARAADVRKLPWTSSALRTFKVFLARRIHPRDLRDADGCLFPCAGDVALMFPMIEMAGDGRHVCLPEINYLYNASNPINDFRVRGDEQRAILEELRCRRPYAPLALAGRSPGAETASPEP